MFYSITGKVAHTGPGMAVIDVGGVAFQCNTSMGTLRTLPPIGGQATLFTYLNVREDALDLYGFASQLELNCYKMLTAISGVGPKAALSILSEMSPEDVALSAAAGDAKRFTRASGVGAKLAQRIVLEMKDKVKGLSFAGTELDLSLPQPGGPSAAGHAAQAAEALVALGYSPSEAAAAVARLDSQLPPEELIRLALKSFGSAV